MGVVNKCGALTPAILASLALIGAMIGNFWCQTIKFEAKDEQSSDLYYGPWHQLEVTEVSVTVAGEYVRFEKEHDCVSLLFAPVVDAKWKTVRAFAIIAGVLGAFILIPLWFVPFLQGSLNGSRSSLAIILLVVLPLCQGLTLLIFRSNACDSTAAIGALQETIVGISFETKCSWAPGSTATVVAIVLWFLAGIAMVAAGPLKTAERRPEETHTVTYQETVAEDGTKAVTETTAVKGGPQEEMPIDSEQP